MSAPREQDISWGANCDRCDVRMDAGRASIAMAARRGRELLCGTCREEDRLLRERDDALAEVERLREALREYATHQSWRCEYPPHFYLVEPVPEGECACGLNSTLRELGLLEASSEPRP